MVITTYIEDADLEFTLLLNSFQCDMFRLFCEIRALNIAVEMVLLNYSYYYSFFSKIDTLLNKVEFFSLEFDYMNNIKNKGKNFFDIQTEMNFGFKAEFIFYEFD